MYLDYIISLPAWKFLVLCYESGNDQDPLFLLTMTYILKIVFQAKVLLDCTKN